MNDWNPEELEKRLANLRAPESPALDARIRELIQSASSPAKRLELVKRRSGSRRLISCGLIAAGVLVGVALCLLVQIAEPQSRLSPPVPIRVNTIQGTVLVKHRGESTWEELGASSQLRVGDQFWAGSASKVSLAMNDGSLVTLTAGGVLSIAHQDGGMEFELTHGTMRAVMREGHPPFAIRTPQGRLEALGTEFTVSVE